jgi:hypothetical protein
MPGRTTRLILAAVAELTRGRDVVIVAHPAEECRRIAARTVKLAKALHVPCANISGAHDDAPRVRMRPLGAAPPMPSRPNTTVCIDHSASFEPGSLRDDTRYVMPL